MKEGKDEQRARELGLGILSARLRVVGGRVQAGAVEKMNSLVEDSRDGLSPCFPSQPLALPPTPSKEAAPGQH